MLLWFLSSPDLQRIARTKATRGELDPWTQYHLAVDALADRRPRESAERARAAQGTDNDLAPFLLAYALALDGRAEEVRPLLPTLSPRAGDFLARTFSSTASASR